MTQDDQAVPDVPVEAGLSAPDFVPRSTACMDDLRCCRNDGHDGDHLYPNPKDDR